MLPVQAANEGGFAPGRVVRQVMPAEFVGWAGGLSLGDRHLEQLVAYDEPATVGWATAN